VSVRVVKAPPPGLQLFDLHNHSDHSRDASNRLEDYERAFARGRFHVLAITDHNTIEGALDYERRATFPLIVGEEVNTADGELIGLFLSEALPRGKSAIETAEAIRAQGGLVYLQHPYYRFLRHRLPERAFDELARRELVDMVEGINGGPLMAFTDGRARAWADRNGLPCAAGSDAHHPGGIGTCVVAVPPIPDEELSADRLNASLAEAVLVDRRQPSAFSLLARGRHAARPPKRN
jgi:predicted metal-dependent phosphoesterase TrpH